MIVLTGNAINWLFGKHFMKSERIDKRKFSGSKLKSKLSRSTRTKKKKKKKKRKEKRNKTKTKH